VTTFVCQDFTTTKPATLLYWNHQRTRSRKCIHNWLRTGDGSFRHLNPHYVWQAKILLSVLGNNMEPAIYFASELGIIAARLGIAQQLSHDDALS
jgi:hypothetical protein